MITGFVFVRFLLFDFTYNLSAGLNIFYIGSTKLYDRIMQQLGGFGVFLKIGLGIVGITFLLGIE
jgi:hypothetical protein